MAASCGSAESSSSPPPPATTGPDGGVGSNDPCPASGTGTLTIALKGLPDGAKAKVTIEGPSGKQVVDAPGAIPVPGGTYSVKGDVATTPDPIVRTAFKAAAVSGTTCVKDGASASVELTYGLVPSSGRVWMLTGQRVSGFASSKLGASSKQTVESFTVVNEPTATAFDRDGGLWLAMGDTIRHFPAARFAATGEKVPDVTLDVPTAPATNQAPQIGGIALDRAGNLWFSATSDNKVRRIAAEDTRQTNTPSKFVTLEGLTEPGSLAFDAAGNLWIADQGDRGINEFKAARLGASPTDGPDIKIAPHELGDTPDGIKRILGPSTIAFDASGNLWALYDGLLVRLTPADLTNSDPVPPVQIVNGVVTQPTEMRPFDTMAFDESGGLWLPYRDDPPTFARFAPSQLLAGSADVVEPERIIEIDPGGFDLARQLAFYPAPAKLPLFASLP